MSVKIRLARAGRKKVPFYRIVVATVTSARDGKFIELLGVYNPLVKEDSADCFKINAERVQYWIGVGAKPTERVAILLNKMNVVGAEKFKPVFVAKPKQAKEEKNKKSK
jgi:small subunit ribosomal protein S16